MRHDQLPQPIDSISTPENTPIPHYFKTARDQTRFLQMARQYSREHGFLKRNCHFGSRRSAGFVYEDEIVEIRAGEDSPILQVHLKHGDATAPLVDVDDEGEVVRIDDQVRYVVPHVERLETQAQAADRVKALDAYTSGFHAGADVLRSHRPRVLEPAMRQYRAHYHRGYTDGRRAVNEHEQAYRAELGRANDRRKMTRACSRSTAKSSTSSSSSR
jgi:hypothetical protein